MNSKFDDLVHSLAPETLEQLRQAVAAEVGGRRQESAIQIENIHARMTDAERQQAMQEIARVLRGEDAHA